MTRARVSLPATTYLARRTAAGTSPREAFRALKRSLVRAVWRLWQECLTGTAPPDASARVA